MAEESGDLPVTPEITKPNNPRRSSMGKASSLNSEEKVIPHYLRASTGSCHDFCKYGRKHASEGKERHPLWKRITKSAPDKQSPTLSVIVPERKKTSLVKPNPSPVSESSFDIPEIKIVKREVSTKSSDGQNGNASSGGQNPVTSDVQAGSGMKKTSAAKLRTSPKLKTRLYESPKFKMQEVSSSYEKVNVSSRNVSSKSKETNAYAKNATSMKLKSPVMKPLPSPDHSGGLSSRRNSDINSRASWSLKPSKIVVKSPSASLRVPLASPRLSVSPKPSIIRVASLNSRKNKSLKVVSPLKNQGKIKKAETEQSKNELKRADNDSIHEETMYVIKMEAEN